MCKINIPITLSTYALYAIIASSLSGCLLEEQKTQSGHSRGAGSFLNSPYGVNEYYGRYLKDNPIIISQNYNLSEDTDINSLLYYDTELIVENQYLVGDCNLGSIGLRDCFEVRKDKLSPLLPRNLRTWAFNANSEEFLQVNTFAHIKLISEKFLNTLNDSTQMSVSRGSATYPTSIPLGLAHSQNAAFWFGQGKKLQGFSDCGVENNAYYDPATRSICLGHDSLYSTVKFAQDPTIIYHEMGHALNHIMINLRNRFSNTSIPDTDLGYLFYDEAGAIGEGISDFFSFVMNGRTHFGEWGLGRFLNSSRPMSEEDSLHAPGISTDPSERLSYPDYLLYDPNKHTNKIEDIHQAGQIISHYLTALTEDFKEYCEMNHEDAIFAVQHLLINTLAELGSQNGTPSDAIPRGINHSPAHSLDWISKVRPINFRSFFQTLSKYFYYTYANPTLGWCSSNKGFPKDRIETLLDEYGLLLFNNYNLDGNSLASKGSIPLGNQGPIVTIEETNRVRTVIVDKGVLKLDPRDGAPSVSVFDDPGDMREVLINMQSAGQIGTISPMIGTDLPYNNGNARISPGEFMGLALNLYNDSNSPIAGVQVLGNDWDQGKDGVPCGTFEDQWPSPSAGAADVSTEQGLVPGECKYITRMNGGETQESLYPICWAHINTDASGIWVGQEKLRENIGLDPTKCLSGVDKTDDCFIRAVKGADHAFYGRIDPKKTFSATMSSEDGSPDFNSSNVVFFEVSPWVPPGTAFSCRFRVRFTNCSGCWNDPATPQHDYLDYEFSGDKPYKIINLQFNVID